MAALTQVTWNTGPLDRAILSAFIPSARAAQAEAIARSPSPSKAKATLKRVNASSLATASATLVPTGLGFVFEQGRRGGYDIFPGGVVGARRSKSRFARYDAFGRGTTVRGTSKARRAQTGAMLASHGSLGGRFFSHVVGGDMAAEPYIHPAGVFWSQVLFPQFATRTLAARGFAAFKYGSHL